jgi:hypothetical protein
VSGPFREQTPVDLDVEARESDAVRALGQWRARLQTFVLATFAVLGVPLGAVGYWIAERWQFQVDEGVASMKANILGAAVAWGAAFGVGWVVARMLLRARTPAKLDELAERYAVPRERLQTIADLVRSL